MAEPIAPPAPPGVSAPVAPPGRVPGWAAWTLRILVLLTAIFVLLQPVFAGMFLAGEVGMRDMHAAGHFFIVVIVFFQIIAAVLVWRPGRGPAWPIWASIAYLLYVEAQASFGFIRMLSLHIPLGVLALGLALLMLVGTWSPRLRVRRSTPPGSGEQ